MTEDDPSPRAAEVARRAREDMRARVAARLFESPRARRIGRFEVEDFVGAGGMGSVYVARDPTLARRVAIKLLHAGLVGDSTDGEHERILREGHALARLSHPNVVQVHEVGAHEGRVFLAMEYVEGESLRDWQGRGARPWREVVRTYCQAAAGLVAAHRAGLVHRDFKPSNAIVGADGRVRVADFGLARAAGPPSADPHGTTGSPGSALDDSLTRSGTILGTPAYMAPEQLAGTDVGAAADQWSFCVALWEALYLDRPYEAGEIRLGVEYLQPRLKRSRGPKALRLVLRRGLAAKASDRWPSMQALHDRLQAVIRPRRAWQLVSIAAVVGVGAAVAARDESVDQCPAPLDAIAPHWDPQRRPEVEAALQRSAPEIARSAFASTMDDLDGYRLKWLQAQVESCRGGLEDDPSARARRAATSSCLERGLVRLDRVVDVLSEADLATFARADELVDALGDPGACLEVDVARPASEDEEKALAKLETAEIDLIAGRVISEAARALVDPSSALWDDASPRLRTAMLTLRGNGRVLAGDAEAGTRDLLDAVNAAEATRLDRAAAELWLDLVESATNHLVATDRADAWLERAHAAVERIGAPHDLALRRERVAALVARERARWPEARLHLERALAHEGVATTLRGQLELELADVEARAGNPESAAKSMTRVLETWTETLGAAHPLLGDAHIFMGRLDRERGDLEAAAAHFAAAASIREAAYGPDSSRVSTPLVGLADVLFRQGDLEGATRAATRAVPLQARLPAAHVERGGALALLGGIAQMREAHAEAATAFMALAEEWRTGPRTSQRPLALNNAAWSLLQAGRVLEARALYAVLKTETPSDDVLHVMALAGLGRADHLAGEHEAAVVELEAALATAGELDGLSDGNPELVPEISWHLAEALDVLGREPGRRCELVRAAIERYQQWPERTEARTALGRLQKRCATTKEMRG
jgi:serine/threonine protein kinase/tetratricopeptide (TPR) repeat protein